MTHLANGQRPEPPPATLNILAISGSLRAASVNSALLRTAQRRIALAPATGICQCTDDCQPGIRTWCHRGHQEHADAALRETLKTMSAVINEAASVNIPLLGANIAESDMAQTPAVAHAIWEALAALYGAVVLRQPESGPAFPV